MVGPKQHSAEDIVRKLRRADELAAEGKTGEEIAAELGVSAATLYKQPLEHPVRGPRGHLESPRFRRHLNHAVAAISSSIVSSELCSISQGVAFPILLCGRFRL